MSEQENSAEQVENSGRGPWVAILALAGIVAGAYLFVRWNAARNAQLGAQDLLDACDKAVSNLEKILQAESLAAS
ncbi:MAG: hypothetical protein IH944_00750 [Armatimonadetes bacterium]|nr:hypothetical protein [Armatimonadota bacterium]